MTVPLISLGQEPFRNINARMSSLKIGGGDDSPAHAPRQDPRVTDAVIAAVREMSKLKSDSSVMMDVASLPQLCAVDRLIQSTNHRIVCFPQDFGPTRLIRWGLFVNDWRRFKDDLLANAREAAIFEDRFDALKMTAIAWGRETLGISYDGSENSSPRFFAKVSQSLRSGFPWAKVFLVGGVVVGSIFAARYWGNRYSRDDAAE